MLFRHEHQNLFGIPACSATVSGKINFFLEHTAGNTSDGTAIFIVRNISRLNHLIHDTPFGDVQPKQIGLIYFSCGNNGILINGKAVQGEIFT